MYEPHEDSYLLESCIPLYAKGNVLDMGTGSGILAAKAAETAAHVTAADIDPEAIKHAKKLHKEKNITFIQSNLFTTITKKFDLIISNPPYLPNHPQDKDIALDGGPQGHEWIQTFLNQAPKHLKPNGIILLLFSSLSHKKIINTTLKNNNLNHKEIKQQKLAFETLYVYKIWKK
ncbi:hypothetical protein CMO92_02420 [Candidatus Woesearchaeota archaeon]|nr:hypothetical protein [Candidatus Woesearchaeota archaeon]|tara:strand:- start:1990 stop:2514 length:525 start_codon:yes stop_codon:yes gene_type:complete